MKSFLFTFMVFALGISSLFCNSSEPVFATLNENSLESEGEVIFEKKEIKNLEQLRERAEKGITDINTEEIPVLEAPNLLMDGEEVQEEMYETTQKLKSVENEENEVIDSYATTIFLDTTVDEEESNKEEDEKVGFIEPMINFIIGKKIYAASKTESTNGVSATVKSYSTIYWSTRTYSGTNQYRLNRVKGGWTLLDTDFYLSNRKVFYGQTGFTEVRTTKYPTSNTFDYTTPSSWGWEQQGSRSAIALHTYVTFKRGNTSVVQHLPNIK